MNNISKISKTQQILDEADKLLKTDWTDKDKEIVCRMMNGLKYYKSFIPSSFKDDIKLMLEMANRIKKEYDELFVRFNEVETNIAAHENKDTVRKQVIDNIEKELAHLIN